MIGTHPSIAAGLTALMVLLFLGSWRSTLIVCASIPLSIATSLGILYALGQTINVMALGGLALAVGILVDDATVEIENSAIPLETAHQAYAAAVESRNYQQQLLQAEIDKFSVGESTNYLIVQDQAYLAQARSTEVAACSDWVKAQLALDHSLGALLEKTTSSWTAPFKAKSRDRQQLWPQ